MIPSSLDKTIESYLRDIPTRGSGGRVDLQRIVDYFGAKVVYKPMLAHGSLTKTGRESFQITIDSKLNQERQRFTLAHELGHLVLIKLGHSATSSPMQENLNEFSIGTSSRLEERTCDEIAARFLVPPALITELGDWDSLTIRSIESAASSLKISVTTLLWCVLSSMKPEGGFIWFRMMGKPTDPSSIKLRVDWGIFPNSRGIYLPKYDAVREGSAIGEATDVESFHPRLKLSFGSLRGWRPVRVKGYGVGEARKVLTIVYPGESELPLLTNVSNIESPSKNG